MLTQRTQGLYRVFLLCQIVIVCALFWLGVRVMVTFYSPVAQLTWNRYSIYCAMLVIGLLGESLSREGSKRYFSRASFGARILAQVRGFRGEVQTSKDIQNRVVCDIEYLENWTFRSSATLFCAPSLSSSCHRPRLTEG